MKLSNRWAVVPAAVAALALSACQESAPSAAPPTPVSPTAAAPTTDAPSAPTTSDSPSAPSTTEQAPPPSPSDTGSGGGSGQCNNTSSFRVTKGSVAAKPLNTPQTAAEDSGDGKAQITFGAPEVKTDSANSFFPGAGMQTVIYSATVKMTSGSSYISTRLAFGLVDDKDNPCQRDTLGMVLPRTEQFEVTSMKPGDTLTKKVAFAVPSGADLSRYSLVYANNYNAGKAELAWTAK